MTKDQLTALKRTVDWGDTWYDGWNAAIDRVITLSGEPPCANCARLQHDIEAGSAEIARLATRYAAAWRMLSALDSERLVPGILGSELRQFVQTNPPDVPLDSSGAVEPRAESVTVSARVGCSCRWTDYEWGRVREWEDPTCPTHSGTQGLTLNR